MATAIFCRREHLHGSPQKVLAAMSVSIVSEKNPQAMPLGQGVCDTEYGKGQATKVQAPVVAAPIHLLHQASDPCIIRKGKAEEAVHVESNPLVLLSFFSCDWERRQPLRRCSSAYASFASRLVALRSIVRGLGHFHQRVSMLLVQVVRDSQAAKAFVGVGPEWASRPRHLPLSLCARSDGSLLSVHFSRYHCERLQIGDAIVRLVTAMVMMSVLSIYLTTRLGHCWRDCMAVYRRRTCHSVTAGDCRHATRSMGCDDCRDDGGSCIAGWLLIISRGLAAHGRLPTKRTLIPDW